MFVLDEDSKIPLYVQLYRQIKADVLSGNMKPGAKLKSSRAVSMEMHISRNTVKLAYDQLYDEGFITSRLRQGYFVEALDMNPLQECEPAECERNMKSSDSDLVYDFRCGRLLPTELPCGQWQRLINRCFHDYRDDLALEKSVFGEMGLRTEIQKYIHHYRDVNCRAEQIVVTTGVQFCLDLACQLLKSMDQGLEIAMEEPGCDESRLTFQNNGFYICPMTLDVQGADVTSLGTAHVAAAYITPSHQFPSGVVMSLSRRNEFVQWAKHNGAFILEDDYNCHFQHDIRPLASLQSLCADRVFYIGSFSDILFPCISVSYMVVPENLLDRLYRKRLENRAPSVSFLTQKPLELFMKEGYWDSHLRKMQKRQKVKCGTLVNELKHKFGETILLSGFHAGLHLLLQVKGPATEEELIRRARRAGVGVYPTSKYWSHSENRDTKTVLLNYGGILLQDIPDAVERLYTAWHESRTALMRNFDPPMA